MIPPDPFSPFVPFYDLDVGRFREDLPFYRALADRTGDPILELGCGTGRVLLSLAEAGHRVTGVDLSAAMLARARARLREASAAVAERVELVHQDVRELSLAERGFRLAFWAINSFYHLETLEDQRRALSQVRDHLASGGLVVIDGFNPTPELLREGDGRPLLEGILEDPEEGGRILKWTAWQTDPALQIQDVLFLYERIRADGTSERHALPFRLRYLHPGEGRLLLEDAGFVVEALYGDYDMGPFTAHSPRMILVGRKLGD